MTNHSQQNETERKKAGLFEEDNGNISSIRLRFAELRKDFEQG